MTKAIIAIALTAVTSSFAQAACPAQSSTPINEADVIQSLYTVFAYAKIGTCTKIVDAAVDVNATESGANEYSMATTTQGIRTSTVYKCDATNEDRVLAIYAKVEKFEPMSAPRQGSGIESGERCKGPTKTFYRMSYNSRVVQGRED